MTAASLRPLHFSQKADRIGIACNSLESGFLVGKMDLDFLGFFVRNEWVASNAGDKGSIR
jgi:hypothetical protein